MNIVYSFNGNLCIPLGYEEGFLCTGIGSGNIQNGRYHFLRLADGKKLKCSYANLFGHTYWEQTEFIGEYKTLFKNVDPRKVRPYIIDSAGVMSNEYIGEDDIDQEFHWVVPNKQTSFEYNGEIWCHLMEDVKPNEILQRSNDWVLVDMQTYMKAFKRTIQKAKFNHYYKWVKGYVSGCPLSNISKDWLEVFIEKVN